MEFKQNGETITCDSLTDLYLDYEPAILFSLSVVSGTPNKFCDLKVVPSDTLVTSGVNTYSFENDEAEIFNMYFIDDDVTHLNFQGYII